MTIEGLSNDVTINGNGVNQFFSISKTSSLTINNIKFVNGYSDRNMWSSVILNNGKLCINNASFDGMSSFLGAVFNKGEMQINNVIASNIKASNYGSFITNTGNLAVVGTTINGGIYNNRNATVRNSVVSSIASDFDYGTSVLNNAFVNCTINDIAIMYSNVSIVNCSFSTGGSSSFSYCNVSCNNSEFYSTGFLAFSMYGSNFTAISSLFYSAISASDSNINISYSAILDGFSNGGGISNVSMNWWGSNKKPSISYGKTTIENWIVMEFSCDENPISVGTSHNFTATLNKYTNGDYLKNIENPSLLPQRTVKFESENGYFSPSSGILNNGTFTTKLIDNTESIIVYAVIDSQRMRLIVGDGVTDYEWYVSNEGHDGFGDGSAENPYKTLSHTISQALTGNTIYMYNGTYKYDWNMELDITKDLTIIGLGNVTISRENDRNIFVVSEWASLVIDNINFTVISQDYLNPLFVVNGGNLTVKNSNFYNISAYSVIRSYSGNDASGKIDVDNVTFSNITGPAIYGAAVISVNNSLFELTTNVYTNSLYYELNNCLNVFNNATVENSIFKKNSVGVIRAYNNAFVKFKNCTIAENTWVNYRTNGGIGMALSNANGSIDNCTFYKNQGDVLEATSINNSNFLENYDGCTIEASIINNSYFYKNVNLVKDGSAAYNGDGIASATSVYNSTFIANNAAYGGALSDCKEIHYCVFVNNTAYYAGSDIFSRESDINCSSNWWGTNQKPGDDRIYMFLGTLTLDNWIIMNFDRVNTTGVQVSLSLRDDEGVISPLNYSIPVRPVSFSSDYGIVTPNETYLVNNIANGNLIFNNTSDDFNVYATLDNQVLSLAVHNNSTELIMEDVSFYGNNNKYNVTLINVNGHRIYNQTLTVTITNPNGQKESFDIVTDELGYAEFDVDYPVGLYTVSISYAGNGYFEGCSDSKTINILASITYLTSYNYTYYGKNNNFYAVLTDVYGQPMVNKTIKFNIYSNGVLTKTLGALTDNSGRANIYLSLDVGSYTIKCEYEGDDWYLASSSSSTINIRPVNSTIIVPDVTFYGTGNVYNITLKDEYGTLISDENIKVVITQGNISDTFTLKTNEKGVASLTINYLPGSYNVTATYQGDDVYGSASGSAVITIEKVYTTLSSFHFAQIPINGIFSVVLTDMFGRRVAGENITLNLYQGTLLKSYYGTTDGNGEVIFLIDVAEGNYLATIDYAGSTWYVDTTSAATIVVSSETVLDQVTINATDLVQYYGEEKFFIISFNDPNTYSLYGKTIVATISSNNWIQTYNLETDVYGVARMKISLNPGNYNVTYKYSNSYYGLFAQGTNTITVYRMPTYISGSDVIMNLGEAKYYEINLLDVYNNPIKNQQVLINLNGTNYNATTNDNGVAKLLLSLPVGTYSISYSIDNPNFESSSGSSIIKVVDSDKTSTNLDGNNVNGLDNQTLNFTVILTDLVGKGISSADILLNVSTTDGEFIGTYRQVTDLNGQVIFKLNLDYGNYIASSYYKGSDTYLESYSINYLSVDSASNKTKTTLYAGNTNLEYNELFSAVLTDVNGTLLGNKEITFSFNGNSYRAVTDENGKAILDVILESGVYSIKISFNGDDNYTKANSHVSVVVSGNLTKLIGEDLVKYYKNQSRYQVQLVDVDGSPLANKTLIINVNGVNYTRVTNESGWASIAINLNPAVYTVVVSYFANNSSENAFTSNNITVLSTVNGDNLVKYYKNNSQYYVKVLDGQGNPIANKSVSMNINGVIYQRTTNDEGIAKLNINLNPGSYIITVTNPNDGLSYSNNITVLSTLSGQNIVKYYKNSTQYQVKVLDGQGNPIKNSKVTMNINGVIYERKTNDEGIAALNINLNPGEYILTAQHENGLKMSNTITVLPILEASDLTMNYGDGSKFTARLVDGQGMPSANKTVLFNINGVFYNRNTDQNGLAVLNINLLAGKYIITSSYGGYSTSNTIIINNP